MKKRKVPWAADSSAAVNARAALPDWVRAYFLQGRKLAQAAASSSAMHRFRLDTKALRYTLELFRPCYGPGLELRLAAMRRIQDFLGAISDYATARELVSSKLPEGAAERVRMECYLDGRSKRKAAEFRRYWRSTFDRPGQEDRWFQYLSRPHDRRGP
jgi:CHAD domain-containing protein